jgi:hypothetical protein
MLWSWPEVSPLRQRLWRERDQYQACPALDAQAQRFGVHMRHHQHLAGRSVGGDAGDEPVAVEFRREHRALFDLGLG